MEGTKEGRKKKKLFPFGDYDKDGVLNYKDCDPFDPTKHVLTRGKSFAGGSDRGSRGGYTPSPRGGYTFTRDGTVTRGAVLSGARARRGGYTTVYGTLIGTPMGEATYHATRGMSRSMRGATIGAIEKSYRSPMTLTSTERALIKPHLAKFPVAFQRKFHQAEMKVRLKEEKKKIRPKDIKRARPPTKVPSVPGVTTGLLYGVTPTTLKLIRETKPKLAPAAISIIKKGIRLAPSFLVPSVTIGVAKKVVPSLLRRIPTYKAGEQIGMWAEREIATPVKAAATSERIAKTGFGTTGGMSYDQQVHQIERDLGLTKGRTLNYYLEDIDKLSKHEDTKKYYKRLDNFNSDIEQYNRNPTEHEYNRLVSVEKRLESEKSTIIKNIEKQYKYVENYDKKHGEGAFDRDIARFGRKSENIRQLSEIAMRGALSPEEPSTKWVRGKYVTEPIHKWTEKAAKKYQTWLGEQAWYTKPLPETPVLREFIQVGRGAIGAPAPMVSFVGTVPSAFEAVRKEPEKMAAAVLPGAALMGKGMVREAYTRPYEFAGEMAGMHLIGKGVSRVSPFRAAKVNIAKGVTWHGVGFERPTFRTILGKPPTKPGFRPIVGVKAGEVIIGEPLKVRLGEMMVPKAVKVKPSKITEVKDLLNKKEKLRKDIIKEKLNIDKYKKLKPKTSIEQKRLSEQLLKSEKRLSEKIKEGNKLDETIKKEVGLPELEKISGEMFRVEIPPEGFEGASAIKGVLPEHVLLRAKAAREMTTGIKVLQKYTKIKPEVKRPLRDVFVERIPKRALAKIENVLKKYEHVIYGSIIEEMFLRKAPRKAHDMDLGILKKDMPIVRTKLFNILSEELGSKNVRYAPTGKGIEVLQKGRWAHAVDIHPLNWQKAFHQNPAFAVKLRPWEKVNGITAVSLGEQWVKKATTWLVPEYARKGQLWFKSEWRLKDIPGFSKIGRDIEFSVAQSAERAWFFKSLKREAATKLKEDLKYIREQEIAKHPEIERFMSGVPVSYPRGKPYALLREFPLKTAEIPIRALPYPPTKYPPKYPPKVPKYPPTKYPPKYPPKVPKKYPPKVPKKYPRKEIIPEYPPKVPKKYPRKEIIPEYPRKEIIPEIPEYPKLYKKPVPKKPKPKPETKEERQRRLRRLREKYYKYGEITPIATPEQILGPGLFRKGKKWKK